MSAPTHDNAAAALPYARAALAEIPKILTLLDRNPHSPTYGCFDRNFWHYKIIDFPSGMAQEFVYPLALAHASNIEGNPFFGEAAVADWVVAGIRYAAASAHPDGSCDDYFPFERAAGAAAFSLLAGLESYLLLGLDAPDCLRFFERRANWLAERHESGRLTNHHALIVLCLLKLGRLLATSEWDRARTLRLEQILAWQSAEGWFPEYEGFDPGYHTLTIGCLAQIYDLAPDVRLKEAITAAVELAAEFVHPDGTYGGEYGSRNTFNFFPHGFELAGHWLPAAAATSDRFLAGLVAGRAPCYADDHIVGHHAWSYLLAWRHRATSRPRPQPPAEGRVWLPEARIAIERRGDYTLYVALNKGGTCKLFRGDRLLVSDTQFSVRCRQGKRSKTAVGHLVGPYKTRLDPDRIAISGPLGWAKQPAMTTLKLLVLRAVMLSVGRFFPNLIRRILQALLITGKQAAPYRFERQFCWQAGGGLEIRDRLVAAETWEGVEAVGLGGAQTSIYVVMSRTFTPSQLQPWFDLTPKVRALKSGDALDLCRRF